MAEDHSIRCTTEFSKAQAAYKRDFDARVKRFAPTVRENDYVFLRKEYYNPKKEKRHKLSLIADGPYRVVSATDTTVVLDIKGQHERISRDRVARALQINSVAATSAVA